MQSFLKAKKYAKSLFKLSLEAGVISPERVLTLVKTLQVESANYKKAILKHYLKLLSAQYTKERAILECPATTDPKTKKALEAFFCTHYAKKIYFSVLDNPSLIAGFKAYIGDELWENSIANTLQNLSAS